MRRWAWLAGVGCLALLLAGWLLAPRFVPSLARRQALARFEALDDAAGLERYLAYWRRFPRHAREHDPVTMGEPVRLVLQPGPLGLRIAAPPLPPGAGQYADSETSGPATAPPVEVVEGPLWLDDTTVAYGAQRAGGAVQMVLLSPLTRELSPLVPPRPGGFTLTFAAAAALVRHPQRETILALRPKLAGAGSPRLLALAPDGSWLIFRAEAATDPPYELWRCRPDGADAHRLATLSQSPASVRFSPDGGRLAFFDGPRVAVVGLADDAATVLEEYDVAAVMQPEQGPAWSPDGARLAYGVGSPSGLRLVRLPLASGGEPLEQPRLNSLKTLEFAGTERLLQTVRELDTEHWAVTSRDPADTFQSRILLDDARGGGLSPDGGQLAVRRGQMIEVYLLDPPLAQLNAEQLTAGTLPERPAAAPAPASPESADDAPPLPSTQT